MFLFFVCLRNSSCVLFCRWTCRDAWCCDLERSSRRPPPGRRADVRSPLAFGRRGRGWWVLRSCCSPSLGQSCPCWCCCAFIVCSGFLHSLGDAVAMLPLPSLPPDLPGRSGTGVRGLGRSALFGCPWDYIVKKGLGSGHTVRSPTPLASLG